MGPGFRRAANRGPRAAGPSQRRLGERPPERAGGVGREGLRGAGEESAEGGAGAARAPRLCESAREARGGGRG